MIGTHNTNPRFLQHSSLGSSSQTKPKSTLTQDYLRFSQNFTQRTGSTRQD